MTKPSAVFAPEDHALIRKALEVYIYNYGKSLPEEESRKLSNLLHRMGRIGDKPPRESYDRYMYRMYKEHRETMSKLSSSQTLENKVDDIKTRYKELSKRVEELEKRT